MKIISKEIALIILVFTISFIYTWLRYVTFGPYHSYDIMLLLNKATAFSIILIIFVAYSPLKPSRLRRDIIGKISFFIALAHVIFSLILLPTDYYKKHHLPGGQMCTGMAYSLIFGIISILSMLAIFQFFRMNVGKDTDYRTFLKLTVFFFISLFLHVFFYGVHNWWPPSKWHGGLPPITLISAFLLLMAFPVALYFIGRVLKDKNENN